ncbi:MAG TPA: ROK family protein [Solirubrobacteraceae bacterium]
MTVALGLDVGATKIAAARVDAETGEILAARRIATAPARGTGVVLADCRRLVTELGDGVPAGLAVCELVDPSGRVRSAETIDWRGVDLLAEFAAVQADVRAGALAEARFGAGREHPDFLYVTVGSGISHCLMSYGVPRMGVRGAAISTGAPLVERWSSGLALARRTGHASAQQALADPEAADVVEDAARRLGVVLAALVNALDPGAVVVGGGLGLHVGYRALVEETLRAEVYDPEARSLPVLPAALGPDAPAIGAALAALAG